MSLTSLYFAPIRLDIDETMLETSSVHRLVVISYEERTSKKIKSKDWYLCKKCTVLKSDKECVCCFEYENSTHLHSKKIISLKFHL